MPKIWNVHYARWIIDDGEPEPEVGERFHWFALACWSVGSLVKADSSRSVTEASDYRCRVVAEIVEIRNAPQDDVYISVLTLAEVRRGIALLPAGHRRAQLEEWLLHDLLPSVESRVLPVTEPIADRWAAIAAEAQLRGRPLAVIDGLIAATAIEHDLTLVTRNERDFSDRGAVLLNPWQE